MQKKKGFVADKEHNNTAAQPLFKGSAEHTGTIGSEFKKKFPEINALLWGWETAATLRYRKGSRL